MIKNVQLIMLRVNNVHTCITSVILQILAGSLENNTWFECIRLVGRALITQNLVYFYVPCIFGSLNQFDV